MPLLFFRLHLRPLFEYALNPDEQVQYWHTISKKYFYRYLHDELKFNEQGKKRFCEMTAFCGMNIEEKDVPI